MFLVIIGNNIRLGFHPHDLFFVTLKKWLLKQPFSRQKTKSLYPIGKNKIIWIYFNKIDIKLKLILINYNNGL